MRIFAPLQANPPTAVAIEIQLTVTAVIAIRLEIKSIEKLADLTTN
jgi:hypothetical protein